MDPAKPCELRSLKPWDRSENSYLVAVLELGLEADHVPQGAKRIVESAGIGLLAARFAAAEAQGRLLPPLPPETALGALLAHITGGATAETYQPMNVNFGLMPPITLKMRKADRKKGYTDRARVALAEWLEQSAHRVTAETAEQV